MNNGKRSVTPMNSHPTDRAYLCRNLRLDIERLNGTEQIRVCLRDDISLEEVSICYDVGDNTADWRYHLQEAIVISLRRVIEPAINLGMITLSRGERTSSKSGVTAPPNPPITFSTDEDWS